MTSAQHTNGTSIPLTEDDPSRSKDNQSVGALVKDAMTQVSTLLRAEVELARSEITADVKQGVRGSLFFIIALTMVVLLMPFLLTTLALVISIWLPMSAGFGIVTGLMLVLAAAFGFLGYRRVRKLRGPRQTISSVKDTAAALKRRESDQPRQL
ncbi:MAG TPA: phage holin family protein [Pseudonocardiaceae bacterium]|nr:phage holin family protein [Pseudonocardiaceae bacterium]